MEILKETIELIEILDYVTIVFCIFCEVTIRLETNDKFSWA